MLSLFVYLVATYVWVGRFIAKTEITYLLDLIKGLKVFSHLLLLREIHFFQQESMQSGVSCECIDFDCSIFVVIHASLCY